MRTIIIHVLAAAALVVPGPAPAVRAEVSDTRPVATASTLVDATGLWNTDPALSCGVRACSGDRPRQPNGRRPRFQAIVPQTAGARQGRRSDCCVDRCFAKATRIRKQDPE